MPTPSTNPGTTSSGRMLRNNLILAAALAVLASFALWYEFKQKPISEKKEADAKKVFALAESTEIETLRLASDADKTDVTLACTQGCKVSEVFNGQWKITKPEEFKAEGAVVAGVVNQLTSLVPSETFDITGPEDALLGNFGLEAGKRGQRRLELKVKGQSDPYVLYLGDKTPLGYDVYAVAEGPGQSMKRAYMVSASLGDFLGKKLSHWKTKRVLDFAPAEVTAIALKGPGGSVTLKKGEGKDAGVWLLGSRRIEADNEAVDTFLTGLSTLTVTDYVAADKARDLGKLDIRGAPRYTARIERGSKDPITVQAYENTRKPAEQYLTLSSAPYVAKIDLAAYQKFQRKEESFRVKTLLRSAEKFNVQAMTLSFAGGPPLEIKQEKGAWSSPSLKELDGAKVDRFLTDLGSVRVTKFLGKAAPSGAKAALSAKLTDGQGKPVREIALSRKGPAGPWYARLSGGEWAEVESGGANRLPAGEKDLVKATAPPQLPPAGGKAKGSAAPQSGP